MTTHRALPPRRPDPPPMETDDVRVIAIGTALWLVAFVALLPFYDRLSTAGRGWWVWTCLAGFGLGLFGVQYCRRRRDKLAAQAEAPPAAPQPERPARVDAQGSPAPRATSRPHRSTPRRRLQ